MVDHYHEHHEGGGGKRKAEGKASSDHRGKTQRTPTVRASTDERKVSAKPGTDKYRHAGGDEEGSKREKVHKLLADALCADAETSRSLARSLAEEIEESLYSLHAGAGPEYGSKARSLKFNLSTNPELREQILTRHLSAPELVSMDSAAMARSELRKRRVFAAEESLKDTINTSEVQKLKEAAEGLMMKKTDQGLVVEVREPEKKEQEKNDEGNDSAEEVAEEGAGDVSPKGEVVQVSIDRDDDKYTKHSFSWKPTEEDQVREELADNDNIPFSPPLDNGDETRDTNSGWSQSEPEEDDEESQLLAPVGNCDEAGHLVWSGTLTTQQKGVPFEVDASIIDGQEQPELMPHDLTIKGTLPLKAVKDYLVNKARDGQKLRSVFRFSASENKNQEAYDALSETLFTGDKAGVVLDSKQILMYILPPGELARKLVPTPEADECLIGVSITTRKAHDRSDKTGVNSKSVHEIIADVASDLAAFSGQEKIVKLVGSQLGKAKIETCRLRMSLVSGKDHLEHIPRELYVRTRTELSEVIKYLSQQERTVVELEPDGEADTSAYLDICAILQEKNRALVVLDTSMALMYLIPPVPDAGSLLEPPTDSPPNLLGILIFNAEASKSSESSPASSSVATSQPIVIDDRVSSSTHRPSNNSSGPAKTSSSDSWRHDSSLPSPRSQPSAAVPTSVATADAANRRTSERPSPLVIGSSSTSRPSMSPMDRSAPGPSPRPHYSPVGGTPTAYKHFSSAHQPMQHPSPHSMHLEGHRGAAMHVPAAPISPPRERGGWTGSGAGNDWRGRSHMVPTGRGDGSVNPYGDGRDARPYGDAGVDRRHAWEDSSAPAQFSGMRPPQTNAGYPAQDRGYAGLSPRASYAGPPPGGMGGPLPQGGFGRGMDAGAWRAPPPASFPAPDFGSRHGYAPPQSNPHQHNREGYDGHGFR